MSDPFTERRSSVRHPTPGERAMVWFAGFTLAIAMAWAFGFWYGMEAGRLSYACTPPGAERVVVPRPR